MGGQRSLKKGPFIAACLVKKVQKAIDQGGNEVSKPIKTWARNSMIIPEFVGFMFLVHNGRTFVPVKVIADMVGFNLGEFAMTRLFKMHSGDRKSK